MSALSLETISLAQPASGGRTLSRVGMAHYLRMGFLPAPHSIFADTAVINSYGGEFSDDFDAQRGVFHRDLRQFVGHMPRENDPDFPVQDAIDQMEALLLDATSRAIEGYDHVFLMASGGKDSLAVAWALRELGCEAVLLHCTNRGREDESEHVKAVAKSLGFECVLLPDNIREVDAFMQERRERLPIPIADPAFFAYVRAVKEINDRLGNGDARRVRLLDGMGNDSYMGHISPHRERRLTELPRLGFLSEGLISAASFNQVLHYGLETLFAPRPERHFSGAFFAVDEGPISADVGRIFDQYAPTVWERRSLLRGAIFDIDCCMRKGMVAAALDPRIDMAYPFLDPKLIKLFETIPAPIAFDFENVINKLLLRRWLSQKEVNSQFISSAKGSFRFTLDELPEIYRTSSNLRRVLAQLGISSGQIDTLHARSKASFVSAQKLAVLYCLDRFLQANEHSDTFSTERPLTIRYSD